MHTVCDRSNYIGCWQNVLCFFSPHSRREQRNIADRAARVTLREKQVSLSIFFPSAPSRHPQRRRLRSLALLWQPFSFFAPHCKTFFFFLCFSCSVCWAEQPPNRGRLWLKTSPVEKTQVHSADSFTPLTASWGKGNWLFPPRKIFLC